METGTKLLKPKEAAAQLAISERTLYSLTKEGKLPAVRLGRSVRYDIEDLADFILACKPQDLA